MIKRTFTLIMLLFTISLVQSASDKEQALKEICTLHTRAIKDGTFDKAIKATIDCREKALTKDELAAVNKCESILPMDKADQVTKICDDINGTKDKFAEVLTCTKQAIGNKFEKFGECFVVYMKSNVGSSTQKAR